MPRATRTEGAPAARGAPVSSPAAGPQVLAILALAAALAAVWALALQPLWATDLGWQLRVGRDLLARGVPDGIPHADDLSWSAAGRPWIELRWLWTLGLAALERAFGFAAVSHAAAALVTLAFALVALAPRERTWAAPCVLAAALAAQQRFLARPETATFVFVAAFLCVLHRARPGGRVAWLLPALQVLWVNTHTLFALGPVLVAAYALAGAVERRGTLRRDGALLAATLAACLVNPYGTGAVAFAWTVWSELHAPIVRTAISELAGPFALAGDFTAQRWFVGLLVAVPLAALAALARARRLDAFLALSTAIGAGLALTSVRNLPLFALPAVPFLVHHLAVAFPARGGRALAFAPSLAGLALAAWTIVDVTGGGFYARQGDPRAFGAGITPARYPAGAAAALRDYGAAARVFATFHESSWLLADGVGSYCDPRIEVFGPAHLERYLRAQADPGTWRRLDDEAQPTAVVAGLDAFAFHRVLRATGWPLVWCDGTAAIFLPARSPVADSLHFFPANRWRALPAPTALPRAARDRFGAFLLSQHEAGHAWPYLLGATAPRARLNLAEVYSEFNPAAARQERETAFHLAPHDPLVASAWALELLAESPPRADQAAAALDPVLRRPDAPARAWALRGEAHGAKGELAAAERCLARAAALDPADEQIRRRLEAIRSARRAGGSP